MQPTILGRSDKFLVISRIAALFLLVSSAALAALTIFVPWDIKLYGIAASVLAAVIGLCFFWPALLIYFLIITSALANLLSEAGSFGGIGFGLSLSGLRWGLMTILAVLVLIPYLNGLRIPKLIIPFLIFILWAFLRWLMSSSGPAGLRDIFLFAIPPLMAIYTYFVLRKEEPQDLQAKIGRLILLCVLVPLSFYLVALPTGLVVFTNRGPEGLLEPRSVAMYLLCVLCFSLAQWTYGRSRAGRLAGAVVSLVAAAIVFFTLSRMASVLVILLFGAFLIKPLGFRRVALAGLIAAITAAVVFLTVPSFRARFFFDPDSITKSFAEMDVNAIFQSVNTMGRSAFWLTTFEHAMERPIVGWGLGSARTIVAELLPQKSVQEYQPHNEYLQIFHDLGLVGLALMLIAWLPLFFAFWKKWKRYDRNRDRLRAKWNMAATLGIGVVLLTALTGTTLHYPPITVTVFVIVAVAFYLNSVAIKSASGVPALAEPSLPEQDF